MKKSDEEKAPLQNRINNEHVNRKELDDPGADLLNLIADILTEVIVKEVNERNRLRQDK